MIDSYMLVTGGRPATMQRSAIPAACRPRPARPRPEPRPERNVAAPRPFGPAPPESQQHRRRPVKSRRPPKRPQVVVRVLVGQDGFARVNGRVERTQFLAQASRLRAELEGVTRPVGFERVVKTLRDRSQTRRAVSRLGRVARARTAQPCLAVRLRAARRRDDGQIVADSRRLKSSSRPATFSTSCCSRVSWTSRPLARSPRTCCTAAVKAGSPVSSAYENRFLVASRPSCWTSGR